MQLNILVGTMTGTAQIVAQEIELGLESDDLKPVCVLMDGQDAGVFAPGGLFLICTSTYGQGDVPDNARGLYESLRATRPDLSGVHYGVIALGDRTYAETFCFGGKKFDALLSELGARRVGEVLFHDAASGTLPEEVALAWMPGWLSRARETLGTPV